MKNYLSLLGIICILSLTSCGKDDINVTINQKGSLKIKVLGLNKEDIQNTTIAVSYGGGGALFEEAVDDNGIWQTDKILQGDYYCSVRVKRNKLDYYDSKRMQIIAGEETYVELKPFENIGDVNLKFINSYNNKIYPNTNVLLCSQHNFSNNYTLDELISIAFFRGKTNSSGTISFTNLPVSNYAILVFLYNDNKQIYDLDNSYLYVNKQEVTEQVIRVYDRYS